MAGVWPLRIPEIETAASRFINCVNRSDFPETRLLEMRTFLHHLQNVNESFEVASLRGSQWTFFEERHHDVDEVAPALHGEAHELLAVIVAAVVLDDVAAPEHLDEEFERRPGARCLGDRELVLDLPAESTPALRTTDIEKQPSPSTKPTAHCSTPGLSC